MFSLIFPHMHIIYFHGWQHCENEFAPFWKGSSLIGKNLLPQGANPFLLKKTFFSEGACCAGKQTWTHWSYLPSPKWRKIHKVCSLFLQLMHTVSYDALFARKNDDLFFLFHCKPYNVVIVRVALAGWFQLASSTLDFIGEVRRFRNINLALNTITRLYEIILLSHSSG